MIGLYTARSRRKMFAGATPLIICAIVMVTLGLIIAFPCFVPARPGASQNACINNLRQLDGAKEQWTLEHHATNLSPVNVPEVLNYIKGGSMPKCPQTGQYHMNRVGLPPHCSNSNHTLKESCRWNIETLNHAVNLWLLEHPSAKKADVITSDLFGFGKALYPVPVCEMAGNYAFDRDRARFRCNAGDHD